MKAISRDLSSEAWGGVEDDVAEAMAHLLSAKEGLQKHLAFRCSTVAGLMFFELNTALHNIAGAVLSLDELSYLAWLE